MTGKAGIEEAHYKPEGMTSALGHRFSHGLQFDIAENILTTFIYALHLFSLILALSTSGQRQSSMIRL